MGANAINTINPRVMPVKPVNRVADKEHAENKNPVISGFVSGTESYFYQYPETKLYPENSEREKNVKELSEPHNADVGRFIGYSYYIPLEVMQRSNENSEPTAENDNKKGFAKSDLFVSSPINPFVNLKPVEKINEPQKVTAKNPEVEKSASEENKNGEPVKVSYKGAPVVSEKSEESEDKNLSDKKDSDKKVDKADKNSTDKIKPEILEPDNNSEKSSSALPELTAQALKNGSGLEKTHVLNRLYYVALNSPEQANIFTTKEIFDALEEIVKGEKKNRNDFKNKKEALLIIGMLSSRVFESAAEKTNEEIKYNCLPGIEFLKEIATKSPDRELRCYAVKALSLTYAPQFETEMKKIFDKTAKDAYLPVRRETDKALKSFTL